MSWFESRSDSAIECRMENVECRMKTLSHLPPFAIFTSGIAVDFGEIGTLHFLYVPFQFLSDSGELGEMAGLDEAR